ncbi:MAG: hypothetical protein K2K38_00530 [Clostridia bacterium]|nr:hypothetical protein [Clostridia bacterium]
MKKLLSATVAIVMGATCLGSLAACNTDKGLSDQEIAQKAISTVRNMHLNDDVSTPKNYDVIGKTKVEETTYDVNWAVAPTENCTLNDISAYVSVGDLNTATNKVTINITQATVEIEYTLKASVTVGSATESVEFTHTVPKAKVRDGETKDVSISFADKANRTTHSTTQQVWEQNNVKLTNDKGSGADIGDYSKPVRIYAGSTVKIEYSGMVCLTFHCSGATYATPLVNSLEAAGFEGAEVTLNGNDVELELGLHYDVLEFAIVGAQTRFSSIDIEAYVAPTTDAQKIAAAKASLTLSDTTYAKKGEYDLPATKGGANVTWAVKETSDYVSITEEGKLKVTSLPDAKTDVVIVATVSSGTAESATKEFTISIVPLDLKHAGTSEDPYSVADAILATTLVPEGQTAAEHVYVKGYVVESTYNSTYKNYTIYIADSTEEDATKYMVYAVKPADGNNSNYITESYGFKAGDLVTFKGKLQNYKDKNGNLTPELTGVTIEDAVYAADTREPATVISGVLEKISIETLSYSKLIDTTLPKSSERSVALSWASSNTEYITVADDGSKFTIVKLPETGTQEVTLTVTATIEGATVSNNTKQFTITLSPQVAAAGNLTLNLTTWNLGSGSYATANSASPYDVNGSIAGQYSVATNQVYSNSNKIQMQGKNGTITVSGKFTTIVITVSTTNEYSGDNIAKSFPTVTVGDSTTGLTPTSTVRSASNDAYTMTYTVPASETNQQIVIKAGTAATYLTEIQYLVAA